MFCELGFPKWLGGFADDSSSGDWFECTVDKFNTINSITFNKHCPMYLAVAATGVWRLFANAPHLLYMYRNLMNECLRPHVALCGALNVAQQGSERGFYPSTQSYQIAHYSTHMPWSWQCLDARGIAHLQQLTHDDFKKLESMYDEQKRTKGLTYVGRDLFFLGWKPGDGLYGRDNGLEYLTQREWENRFCTGGVLESRYASRTMTSEELLTWLNGLQQDAKALKGKDLHLPKRQIDKIIKDAQSKKERTAKFKAKLLKQTTGATHESNSRT